VAEIRIGLAQIDPRLGDVQANVCKHLAFIEEAGRQEVQILIFPELSLTGYFIKDLVSEVGLRANSALLAELGMAAARAGLDIVLGFVEESPRYTYFNAAAYFHGGRLHHIHRKVYLPTYGLFDEQRYIGRGERIAAFDTPYLRSALLICEDMWHPSTVYVASQDGADLLICPSCSPGRGIALRETRLGSADSWERLCRTYAEFFVSFVVYCNRVGFEDGVNFWGGSLVVAPDGTVLLSAPLFEEGLYTVSIDPKALQRERVKLPLLRDERLDVTLQELQRIARARYQPMPDRDGHHPDIASERERSNGHNRQ
jgi:predicted amidohydrolase